MDEMKKCSRCGRELPVTEFNWRNRQKGTRQEVCRECFSSYNRQRYQRNPGKFRGDVKQYRADHPDAELRTRIATHQRHPTKQTARRALQAAVSAGVATRPDTCQMCGARGTRLEAHHSDYSKPLEVAWLCPTCHWVADERRRQVESGVEQSRQEKNTTRLLIKRALVFYRENCPRIRTKTVDMIDRLLRH